MNAKTLKTIRSKFSRTFGNSTESIQNSKKWKNCLYRNSTTFRLSCNVRKISLLNLVNNAQSFVSIFLLESHPTFIFSISSFKTNIPLLFLLLLCCYLFVRLCGILENSHGKLYKPLAFTSEWGI